jgi:hypothetical protein
MTTGSDEVTPAATPSDAESANQFLHENFTVYRDRNHPKHAETVARVRALFSKAYPPPPEPKPSTPAPQVTKPTEQSAEAPKPPKPVAPEDRVPSSPNGYTFVIPPPSEGESWSPTTWPAVLGDAHTAGLSHRQAESWASFVAASVIPRAVEGGFEAIATESFLRAAAQRLRWLGVPDDKAKALLEHDLERLVALDPRPTGRAPEIGQAEELTADPANGYRDKNHPKHKSTLAKVRELFAAAERHRHTGA